jgi:hypothetical protein
MTEEERDSIKAEENHRQFIAWRARKGREKQGFRWYFIPTKEVEEILENLVIPRHHFDDDIQLSFTEEDDLFASLKGPCNDIRGTHPSLPGTPTE